jgi:hypothetical protein
MSQIINSSEQWQGHSFAEVEIYLKKQLAVLKGDFVDLGLPSGTMWAKCNLGATNPEESGNYYMWGDINGHTKTEGYNFSWGNGWDGTNKRFDPDGNYGKTDAAELIGDIPVDAKYDAARASMGGCARLPTSSEAIELNVLGTWTWTTLNGVNGYNVTGPNGNSIFLPAAGIFDGSELSNEGTYGYYWVSTLGGVENGCYFYFNSGSLGMSSDYRYFGYSVRAVQ